MKKGKYWIAVVSKDHVLRGVSGGFIQVCHGKEAPLKRMNYEDGVIYYSPEQSMIRDEKCQAFTAIGHVMDENVYQHAMSPDFIPFRRNVLFQECSEIPILPLIPQLSFIQDKSRWGYPFRFGILEINESDFNIIASKMLTNEGQR